jgi:hypothetical protein
MQILDFYSDGTFVAFLDISGFKEKMKKSKESAWNALDRFYSEGYESLIAQRDNNPKVEGVFVSDCGILFVRNEFHENDVESLRMLLRIIKKINENLLIDKIHLTASIAYGEFEYRNKIGFEGLRKNPLAGNAYLEAYNDTETRQKAEPGQCRLIARGLPDTVKNSIEDGIKVGENGDPFAAMKGSGKRKRGMENSKYYYFYWMARTPEEIVKIDTAYKRANQSKYIAIHQTLKHNYSWIEYLDRMETN